MASYGPEEDFVDEMTVAGVRRVVELKPDGRNIPLTLSRDSFPGGGVQRKS